jgi:hypothetical protein
LGGADHFRASHRDEVERARPGPEQEDFSSSVRHFAAN